MRQVRSLWPTVSVSLVAISAFPIYAVFVLAPHFEELLVRNTKNEAIRLASSFSTLILEEEELRRDALPTHLLDRLGSAGGDGHLVKVRVYSPRGEILYSSEPTEVGRSNDEAYFKDIELGGTARAEIIPRHSRSLENEVVPADVVETYVPITRGGRLVGVFELYHNVSRERRDLNGLIYRSYGTLFVMALALLGLVLATSDAGVPLWGVAVARPSTCGGSRTTPTTTTATSTSGGSATSGRWSGATGTTRVQAESSTEPVSARVVLPEEKGGPTCPRP